MRGLLEAAEAYHRRGWCIIPIRNNKHKKESACLWKRFETERPTEAELRALFRPAGLTGLAVLMGAISGGLYARDFDAPGAFERWAARYPDVARTIPKVLASRGPHLYGVWPGARFLKLPDGELQAEGGHYCLLPPSVHPNGHIYQWAGGVPATIPTLDPATVGLDRAWCPDKPEPPPEVVQSSQSIRRYPEYSEVVGGRGQATPNTPATCPPLAELIRQTLPTDFRQNNDLLFYLARGVRALEDAEGRRWEEEEMFTRVFLPWYEANRFLREGQPREQYWSEFLSKLDDVRVPLGQGILEQVFRRALAAPPPAEAAHFRDPRTRLLAAFCRELQREAGAEPFFLSVRAVSDKLQLNSPSRGTSYLRRLMREGILAEVCKGGRDSNKATRFKYLGEA